MDEIFRCMQFEDLRTADPSSGWATMEMLLDDFLPVKEPALEHPVSYAVPVNNNI